jgi:NTE family protein
VSTGCNSGQMVKNVALVLGGGGSAGQAWTIGVIAGLAEAGIDMTEAADLVIGASSGATAAALVRSGIPPAELLASILSQPDPPVGQNRPTPPGPPIATVFEHRRCRHFGSRSATCDGRVRPGKRHHPRTRRCGTLARDGRRQVTSA